MSHLKHSTRASISTCRWISILLHKENFELICWVSFCTRNTTHRFSKSTSNWFWISISIWVSMGVRLIIPAWCNEAVCCVLLCCGVTWGRQSNAALQLSQLETDRLMARLAMASGKFPFFLPPSAFHQYPSRLLMKTRCSQHKKSCAFAWSLLTLLLTWLLKQPMPSSASWCKCPFSMILCCCLVVFGFPQKEFGIERIHTTRYCIW